jgi:hypothetical protein
VHASHRRGPVAGWIRASHGLGRARLTSGHRPAPGQSPAPARGPIGTVVRGPRSIRSFGPRSIPSHIAAAHSSSSTRIARRVPRPQLRLTCLKTAERAGCAAVGASRVAHARSATANSMRSKQPRDVDRSSVKHYHAAYVEVNFLPKTGGRAVSCGTARPSRGQRVFIMDHIDGRRVLPTRDKSGS